MQNSTSDGDSKRLVSGPGDEDETAVEEGITLYDEVLRVSGTSKLHYFSNKVDLRSIQIICLLGEGSFAKVYLVRRDNFKETKVTRLTNPSEKGFEYYAMKVLDKTILREKDYFSYVKLER